MQKTSLLQQIEDYYVNLGHRGSVLRKILARDKKYQRLLKKRKQKLSKQFKATSSEKKKYGLTTDIDFEILAKCKQLERLKLMKDDKLLVKLIKTQLEYDWRRPLLRTLNQLLRKYKQKV